MAAQRRIQSLDGLRACATALVLFAHCFGARYFLPQSAYGRFGDLGNLGVRIFFVLSGYLITTLLLAEYDKTGRIELKTFYLRRAFRLCPALYAYLALIGTLGLAHVIAIHPLDLVKAAVYVTWYSGHGAWTQPTWSLAIEEQFYVLWPAILTMLGRTRAVRCAVGAMVAAPLFRLSLYIFWPGLVRPFENTFPTTFDSLATGCCLAFIMTDPKTQAWLSRIVRKRTVSLAPAFILLAPQLEQHPRLFTFVMSLMNVAIALMIARWTSGSSFATSVLNLRPIAWLGTISYSLYLWQSLFVADRQHWWEAFPVSIVLAVVFATASFYLVEQPVLRLRSRFFPANRHEINR